MTGREWIDLVAARGGVLSARADELSVEPNVLTDAEREELEAVKLEVIAALAEEVPFLGMSRAAHARMRTVSSSPKRSILRP